MPVLNPESIATLGLGSFPFARRYLGNRFLFLFLRILRCFSSPGIAHYTYLFSIMYHIFDMMGSPIRTSADQQLFALPRSFSQLTTSFIAFWCQGILPVLLVAFFYFSIAYARFSLCFISKTCFTRLSALFSFQCTLSCLIKFI